MKIKIFTEGGSNIGLGHISRCSALYDEIISRGEKAELIVYGDAGNSDLFSGVPITEKDWLSEEYLNKFLDSEDYCIVDSYLASENLCKIISFNSKRAIFIDDNSRIVYPKGIVVNPSLCVGNLYYPIKEGTTYLLGAKYIILRSPFEKVEKKIITKEVNHVLITLGGADTKYAILEIFSRICEKHLSIKFNVIMENSFQENQNIQKNKPKNVELFSNIDAELMKAIMVNSDLAITAAGQTIYELLATSTPFIAIKTVDNQINNIRGLKEINPDQIVIEYSDDLFLEKLSIAFSKTLNQKERQNQMDCYQNIIDSYGKKRILDCFLGEN